MGVRLLLERQRTCIHHMPSMIFNGTPRCNQEGDWNDRWDIAIILWDIACNCMGHRCHPIEHRLIHSKKHPVFVTIGNPFRVSEWLGNRKRDSYSNK